MARLDGPVKSESRTDIKEILGRLYKKSSDDDIIGNAAQVAFYFSFALFPLLLFLMSLLGLLMGNKQEMQDELIAVLAQAMPASAFELVRDTLQEVRDSASGSKVTLGIIVTLWSASAGIDNMRGTLNEVYNLEETRTWLRSKLTSLALTLAIGLLVLIGLGFLVYGSQLLNAALPLDSPLLLESMEWAAVLVLLLIAFALLYNFLPNHEPFQWRWISPGAILGIALWLILTGGFRLYLRYFDSYAATYGSLGTVIILLLWLYLTALVILIGGAVNAIMDESSGVEKENLDERQVVEEATQTSKDSKV